MAAKLEAVAAELADLKRQVFGKKSERRKPSKMPAAVTHRPTPEQTAEKRRATKTAREAKLETEIVPVPVPPAQCACPKCGATELRLVGDGKSSVVIEYVPSYFRRRVYQRETRACRCGEYIVTAPAPDRVGEGTRYAPSFVAHLVVSKCADAGAQHRLEKAYARTGVPIARSTMNDLFHRAADELRPLWSRMRVRVRAKSHVAADETSIVMQDRSSKAFVWTFVTDDLLFYEFAISRSGETPVNVLGESTGAIQCDAYSGYNKITKPGRRTRAGCLAHARRKIFECRELPEATEALELIRDLYRIEHDAKKAGFAGSDAHAEMRRTRGRPLYAKLLCWAHRTRAANAPKTKFGKAARYILKNFRELGRYLGDVALAIDNNAAERALRRVALGRKNFLFVGNEQAGQNLAVLYSLVATAEHHGLNPLDYLTDVLTRVGKEREVDALLPDRWKPPDTAG
jgi:transposase